MKNEKLSSVRPARLPLKGAKVIQTSKYPVYLIDERPSYSVRVILHGGNMEMKLKIPSF